MRVDDGSNLAALARAQLTYQAETDVFLDIGVTGEPSLPDFTAYVYASGLTEVQVPELVLHLGAIPAVERAVQSPKIGDQPKSSGASVDWQSDVCASSLWQ